MDYARQNIMESLIRGCKELPSYLETAVSWLQEAREQGPAKAFDYKFIRKLDDAFHRDGGGTKFEGYVMAARYMERLSEALTDSRSLWEDPGFVADAFRFKSPNDDGTELYQVRDKRFVKYGQYTNYSVPCVPFPLLALGWFDHDTVINLPHYCDGERLPLSELHQKVREKSSDRQNADSIGVFIAELIIAAIDETGKYAAQKVELIDAMRCDGLTEQNYQKAQVLADYVDRLTVDAQLTPKFIQMITNSVAALPDPNASQRLSPAVSEDMDKLLASFPENATYELSSTHFQLMCNHFERLLDNALEIFNPIFSRLTRINRAAEDAAYVEAWLEETHQIDVPGDASHVSSGYVSRVDHLGLYLPREFSRPRGGWYNYDMDPLGFKDAKNRIEPWAPHIGDQSPRSIEELAQLYAPPMITRKAYTDSDRAIGMLRFVQNLAKSFVLVQTASPKLNENQGAPALNI